MKSTIKRSESAIEGHYRRLTFMKFVPNIRGRIITFLSWKDLISITGTCKQLRQYMDAEYLWKQHLRKRKTFTKSANPILQCIIEHRILSNYFSQKYTLYDMIGHEKAITTIDISKEQILTGAKDNAVKLWNIKSPKKSKELISHVGQISQVKFINNVPVCASADKYIRIFKNTDDPSDPVVLKGHGKAIISMKTLSNNTIVSSSYDNTIKLWDFTTGKIKDTMTIGQNIAFDTYNEEIAAFHSNGKFISIIDANNSQEKCRIQKYKYIISVEADLGELNFLKFLDENRVMTGLSGKVKVWDIREESKWYFNLEKMINLARHYSTAQSIMLGSHRSLEEAQRKTYWCSCLPIQMESALLI